MEMTATNETVAENINTMRTFNVMFAMIIAFGVVYNTARIALSERGRDLDLRLPPPADRPHQRVQRGDADPDRRRLRHRRTRRR